MKKLLLAVCLLVLPVFAAAQQQPSRETLLTEDGTLFSVESRVTEDEGSSVSAHLVLRAQGTIEATEIIPATLDGGSHREPAIAYDAESRTLFVFWLHHVGMFNSELMFACRDANGTWTPARTFGDRFDYRENLRIAVTRKVSDADGKPLPGTAISVHLTWWEDDSDSDPTANPDDEAVQYAMVVIENGAVVGEPQFMKLSQFIDDSKSDEKAANEETAPVAVDENLLKQPHLFTSANQDSVLLVFGDFRTNRIHQVRVRPTKERTPPVSNGRLRVPVGRGEGSMGSPRFAKAANGRVEGIYAGDRMALYTRGEDKIEYVLLKNGAWTDMRAIALDTEVTSSAAVDALRRLVHDH
ncbi:MAG TPA: hypothetical protein VHK90_11330 [Thermoanaerobaculia bacterium]|nr:hypothetical protein [Thermoanaerobaculia bacterium]